MYKPSLGNTEGKKERQRHKERERENVLKR